MNKLLISAGLLLTISGCGGGGSSVNNNDNVPPTSTPTQPTTPTVPSGPSTVSIIAQNNGFDFYGDALPETGKNIGLGIHHPTAAKLIDIKWTQTSGDALPLIADHTNVISFSPASSGTYSFAVTATTCANEQDSSCGTASTANISINVQPRTNDASIRLDHSAVERGRVSVRVDPLAGKTIDSVEWVQSIGIDAVQAQDVEEQDNRLFFEAPSVTRDSILQFTANVTFTDNTTATDDVFIGVRNSDIDDDGYFPRYSDNIVSENMFAHNPSSPYKAAIERCVYTNQIATSCPFRELPLIGMDTMNPSIDDIMDRVLVSHQWMGDRFRQYLQQSQVGPDMLRLLRGVTAIVISYEVRPSFYWAVTGAIYLDADNFWLTPLERDTLNEIPDYRSGFGSDLQFIMPWRYVKNNDYYPAGSYPINDRGSRSFVDLEGDISWLMYHELGHSNDFFPPAMWNSLSLNRSPLQTINLSNNNPLSDELDERFPLSSRQMHELAEVNFGGEDANSAQRNTTAQDVTNLFINDTATGFYNYYTTREDYASLFEKFMMKYRLDADSDIAVVSSVNNDDYQVTWGQRNRFNDPALQQRVLFAVTNILPELDAVAIQQTLPAPQLMDPSKTWFANLRIGTAAKAATLPKFSLAQQQQRIQQDTRIPFKPGVSLPEE